MKPADDSIEEDCVGEDIAFADLIRRVEEGNTVTITRRGRKIATIVPADQAKRMAAVRKAMAGMDEIRKRAPLEGLSIRDLINEGRR